MKISMKSDEKIEILKCWPKLVSSEAGEYRTWQIILIRRNLSVFFSGVSEKKQKLHCDFILF